MESDNNQSSDGTVTRGHFLYSGLAIGALGLAGAAKAAEPTDAEKANLALVTEYCQSFSSKDMAKVASYMAPNCVYRATETTPPVTGPAAVEKLKGYVDPASKVDFKIFDSWARGPIVVNERTDTFVMPQRTMAARVIGVFFVKDGKIAEWTDYLIR